MRRCRPEFRMERRTRAPHYSVGAHHPLRNPPSRLYQTSSQGCTRASRDLQGLGGQGGYRLPQIARRHLDRAAADPHLHQRQPPARTQSDQLLGYNSVGFFAPDCRYAHEPEQTLREFKEMVAALHAANLKVILDVVYNHTAEGNERGPTLSFKGIDNASYYRLLPDEPRYYINDTGTGNTLNLTHPRVIQMVTDSLRYWVAETLVDGFRFDLGTLLAREPNGFDDRSGFLK